MVCILASELNQWNIRGKNKLKLITMRAHGYKHCQPELKQSTSWTSYLVSDHANAYAILLCLYSGIVHVFDACLLCHSPGKSWKPLSQGNLDRHTGKLWEISTRKWWVGLARIACMSRQNQMTVWDSHVARSGTHYIWNHSCSMAMLPKIYGVSQNMLHFKVLIKTQLFSFVTFLCAHIRKYMLNVLLRVISLLFMS